jgi:hypothetical protein
MPPPRTTRNCRSGAAVFLRSCCVSRLLRLTRWACGRGRPGGVVQTQCHVHERASTSSRVSAQNAVSMVFDSRQASTARLALSMTATRLRKPRPIGMWVTPASAARSPGRARATRRSCAQCRLCRSRLRPEGGDPHLKPPVPQSGPLQHHASSFRWKRGAIVACRLCCYRLGESKAQFSARGVPPPEAVWSLELFSTIRRSG